MLAQHLLIPSNCRDILGGRTDISSPATRPSGAARSAEAGIICAHLQHGREISERIATRKPQDPCDSRHCEIANQGRRHRCDRPFPDIRVERRESLEKICWSRLRSPVNQTMRPICASIGFMKSKENYAKKRFEQRDLFMLSNLSASRKIFASFGVFSFVVVLGSAVLVWSILNVSQQGLRVPAVMRWIRPPLRPSGSR